MFGLDQHFPVPSPNKDVANSHNLYFHKYARRAVDLQVEDHTSNYKQLDVPGRR